MSGCCIISARQDRGERRQGDRRLDAHGPDQAEASARQGSADRSLFRRIRANGGWLEDQLGALRRGRRLQADRRDEPAGRLAWKSEDSMNVEFLLAAEGIRQLHARYIDAVLRVDYDAFRACWTEDAEWRIS